MPVFKIVTYFDFFQIFKKITFLGWTEAHEDKLLAMMDFILKLHRARAG